MHQAASRRPPIPIAAFSVSALVKCAARYVALIGVRSALLCPNRGPLQVAQDCEPGRSPAAGQSQRGVKCDCLTEPEPFWLELRVGTERPVAVVLHFPRQRPLFSFIRVLIICLCLGPTCATIASVVNHR